MIDNTVPAFIFSTVPGLNMLGIESFYLQKCGEAMKGWPMRVRYAKWIAIGAFLIAIVMEMFNYNPENETRYSEVLFAVTQVLIIIALLLMSAGILTGMVVAFAALTNSSYCSITKQIGTQSV